MANCSIPNSSPASGRISTGSLRRSRRQNRQPRTFVSEVRHSAFSVQKRRQAAALQGALSALEIRHWTLDVERLEFSAIRRVKGAWWPSRSSKPSSPRKWRGRFDSYSLRLFICDCRLPICDCFGTWRTISIANRNSKIKNSLKGDEPYVA
jgi:hypothetical protein